MSINVFALTAAKVRAHMFPRWPEFSARSSPTDTTVGEIITEQAAELEGKLYTENIAASGITNDATAAYQWCVRTLKLMCALAILSSSTMSDPELSKKYERELKARLDELAEKGGTALGNDGLETGDSPADGPTTHINQFGLTTLSSTDMSDATPLVKKSDQM